MYIVFRCDANKQVGLGHLNRCIPLAEYLPDAIFMGNFDSVALRILKAKNLRYCKIDQNVSFDLQVLDNLKKHVQLVIFDSYELFQNSSPEQINNFSYKWGVFDDTNEHSFKDAKFVVNFRMDAENFTNYDSPHNLLGIKYLPITKAFVDLRKKNLNNNIIAFRNILIFVGGEDLFQKGETLVTGAIESFENAKICYVSRSPYHHPQVENLPIADNFTEYLDNIDFCITGGGKVKYELAFAGIPVLSYAQTELQDEDSRILESKNIIIRGKMISTLTKEDVVSDLKNISSQQDRLEKLRIATKSIFRTNPTKELANKILSLT